MRTSRTRAIAGVALAVLTYAGGSIALLELASAKEQERLTIAEGEQIEVEYPRIPASDPARATVKGEAGEPPLTPEECNQVPATCDVIPLTILPPAQLGPEFLIRINLYWESEPDPSGFTSFRSDDLDMYLWNDPTGEQTVTYSDDGRSANDNPGASGRMPERINYFTTEPGNLNLVVNNYLGENTGYRLEVQYFSGILVKPFESLDPSAQPVDRSGGPPPGSGTSGSSGSSFSTPPPAPSTVTTLPPLDVVPDGAFDDLEGFDEQAFAAPPSTVPLRTRQISVAEEVPALVLVLWFVVVPLLALAAGGWLLAKRSRRSMRVPTVTATA